MSYLSERSSLTILLGTLAFMLPACALASNGLYLTGYGNESVFMGGADVAVARDAFAANNNPAGMTQITSQAAELELAAWDFQEGSHTDSLNYRKPYTKNLLGAYGNAAYARRFENSPYAAGVALVVQGGIGWTFNGLNTVFGTRDDASSLFTVVKLAPACAWKVNDNLSVGVMLGINYVAGTQELFPNTSVPGVLPGGQPFTGFRFKEASGIG